MREVPDLQGGLAPYYYDWMAHPEYDDYWKAVSIEEAHSDIEVPAFNFLAAGTTSSWAAPFATTRV